MKNILILFVLLFVGGCSLLQHRGASDQMLWEQRQSQLEKLQQWQIKGRISIFTQTEAWHAGLHWRQRNDNYSIDLVGPLGQGRLTIQGNDHKVLVTLGDGKQLVSDDPADLLRRATGFAIPIKGLVYWIRGLPAPDKKQKLTVNDQGQLSSLDQQGWRIQYRRYQSADGISLSMPALIRADGPEQLNVKVAINDWLSSDE